MAIIKEYKGFKINRTGDLENYLKGHPDDFINTEIKIYIDELIKWKRKKQ
jgi:hypothetical protein